MGKEKIDKEEIEDIKNKRLNVIKSDKIVKK